MHKIIMRVIVVAEKSTFIVDVLMEDPSNLISLVSRFWVSSAGVFIFH